ncbi:MAG TPA: tetratricopeptide repeat protein, partial [Blastocatellia bacterium]|nr:tetratricopeptide repeat protein [Blastocatellia bacterium]
MFRLVFCFACSTIICSTPASGSSAAVSLPGLRSTHDRRGGAASSIAAPPVSVPISLSPNEDSHRGRGPSASDQKAVAAKQASDEGDRLIAEWREASSKQAIIKYQQAVADWREAGDTHAQSQALLKIGDVYNELGKLDSALRFYDSTLVRLRKTRDTGSVIEALTRK